MKVQQLVFGKYGQVFGHFWTLSKLATSVFGHFWTLSKLATKLSYKFQSDQVHLIIFSKNYLPFFKRRYFHEYRLLFAWSRHVKSMSKNVYVSHKKAEVNRGKVLQQFKHLFKTHRQNSIIPHSMF